MARFGQQFIAGLLQPSYQEGLFTAAQQLGARPRQIAEKRQEQQMLGGLVPGTPEYSEALARLQMQRGQLAEAAITGAAGVKQAETQRMLTNLKAAAKAKASKSPNAAELVPLVENMGIPQLQEYLKPSTPSEFTLSKGQVRFRGDEEIARVEDTSEIKYVVDDVVNTKTGLTEAVRIGYLDNEEVSRNVIGLVPSKDGAGTGAGGAGGKQTLAQFFKDKGIEVDLDTIEGLQQAQQAAYFDLSNASLANSIGTIIEQKKDPGVKEGLDILQTQPEVKQAQEDLVLVNKFKSLAPLTDVDTAGASRLLQRIVTATAPNDLKAVAELNAFTSAQGLKDRIDDFFSMIVTGQLSEETIKEYENTINAIEQLSNRQITNAARRLSIYGNEREQKAAQNVLNFYGASTARVVSE